MLTVVIIVNVIFMGAVGCQSAGMLELVGFMINTSVGCLVVFLWPWGRDFWYLGSFICKIRILKYLSYKIVLMNKWVYIKWLYQLLVHITHFVFCASYLALAFEGNTVGASISLNSWGLICLRLFYGWLRIHAVMCEQKEKVCFNMFWMSLYKLLSS